LDHRNVKYDEMLEAEWKLQEEDEKKKEMAREKFRQGDDLLYLTGPAEKGECGGAGAQCVHVTWDTCMFENPPKGICSYPLSNTSDKSGNTIPAWKRHQDFKYDQKLFVDKMKRMPDYRKAMSELMTGPEWGTLPPEARGIEGVLEAEFERKKKLREEDPNAPMGIIYERPVKRQPWEKADPNMYRLMEDNRYGFCKSFIVCLVASCLAFKVQSWVLKHVSRSQSFMEKSNVLLS